MLATETPSAQHTELDLYPTHQLIDVLIDDQFAAVHAVRAAGPQITDAITQALPRILQGGRLIYVGAGTSGRLGVLDSVELFPTFSWPTERAIGILAGGSQAMFNAIEGAEDDALQGAKDLLAVQLQKNDVVVLLAASGTTPYVMGALQAARDAGALTIGIANNVDAPLATAADIGITLNTGNEIISGSTRLKAATAQKIALNTFSSGLMIKLNKVYGNLMVDFKPTNAKLLRRAVSLTMFATGCDEASANNMLAQCKYHVKTALVALLNRSSIAEAQEQLELSNGNVRNALKRN
ncbi:MAG: N-acetylmuramic acid 6-phosphate etherase [Pseudomonadota bacterium]